MNPEPPSNSRAELEARVTAWLLGELPPEEASAMRDLVEKDVELQKLRDRLTATLKLLQETIATPTPALPLKLNPEKREALLAHFKTVALPPRRNMSWLMPLAAAAVLVISVFVFTQKESIRIKRIPVPPTGADKKSTLEKSVNAPMVPASVAGRIDRKREAVDSLAEESAAAPETKHSFGGAAPVLMADTVRRMAPTDLAFTLAESSLTKGVMPETNRMNSDQFINAFDYHDPVGFTWELASDPFARQRSFIRISPKSAADEINFNPERVSAYRQLGNHFYVLEINASGQGPLGTVRGRVGTNEQEQSWSLPYTNNVLPLEKSSPAMRLAATAATFAEWLAGSPEASEVTPDQLLQYFRGVPEAFGADARPKKLEEMIEQAKRIAGH